MLQYFQPLINYIHQHPHVGELIAFLVAFAESLPLIGTIIPGSITMTAIGTLVGAAILPGFSTLGWAALGALTGDTIGFGVGLYFTDTIPKLWPFRKHPNWLQKSEDFFEKHGGKSIIIGRFVGPARSTVPLVAGILKMKWLRFILAAIPSAILWALLYMVPGILLGALALELPPHIATEFVLIGLATIVALWLAFWALQYFFSQLAHSINVIIDNTWDWLIHHKPSRPFIRLISVKGKPADHYQLTLTLLCIVNIILFLSIFYSVITKNALTHLNQPIFHLLQSLRTKPIDTFFIIITLLGQSTCMLTIGVLVAAGLAWIRQWRTCLHMLALDFLTAACVWSVKHIYHNPRPTGFQFVSSSSFPSGHTAMSFVIISFLAYLTGKFCKKSLRWIPYTTAIILIFFIALSRLYLGAHWLTDVFGSFFLGFAILFAIIINYRRRAGKRFQTETSKSFWFILLIACIVIPWMVWIIKGYRFDEYRYTPVWPKIETSYQQWWRKPLTYLPTYRLNRFGKPVQPFNLQWAGNLNQIAALLLRHHWKEIELRYSVKNTFRRFTKKNPEYHMPLLPWLYRHQPPTIVLIRHVQRNKSIIELRLWNSEAQFTNNKITLWIGTINYHIPAEKLLGIHRFAKEISLQESGGIKQLIADLKKQYQYKILNIPTKKQPKKVQPLNWDGNVIVIRKRN